jgi:hypothetical protein
MATANFRQIKTFNSATHVLSISFTMTQTLYNDWVCWMQRRDIDWFYMDLVTPRTPENIVSTNLFRLVAGTQQVKAGHNYIRVDAAFEMVPGAPDDPNAPVHTWLDFIDAGTPAAPSTDIIVGGTPASPSTDLIEARLYGYE